MNKTLEKRRNFLRDKMTRGIQLRDNWSTIVRNSREMYYKKTKVKGDVNYVDRGLAKAISDSIPSVVRPFTSQPNPVSVPNKNDIMAKMFAETYANYILEEEVDMANFLTDWATVKARDGTAFIFGGWKTKRIKRKQVLGIWKKAEFDVKKKEEKELQYEKISEDEGRVYIITKEEVENKPDYRILQHNKVVTDPDSNEIENFIAIEEKKILTSKEERDRLLNKDTLRGITMKDELSTEYMMTAEPNSENRQHIAIYKAWFTYNEEEIYAEITTDLSTIITWEPNYSEHLPVLVDTYVKVPHSTRGLGLAFLIGKDIDAREQIMKDILKIINKTRVGTTLVKGNGISFSEMNRYSDGEEFVFVKDVNAIKEITPPQISSSTLTLESVLSRTIDETSRISRQTLDSGNFGEDAQKAISFIEGKIALEVDSMAIILRKMLRRSVKIGRGLLSDNFIIELMNIKEESKISEIREAKLETLTMQIVSDGTRNKKIAELNMLMQNARTMSGVVSPETMRKAYAEFFLAANRSSLAMDFLQDESEQNAQPSQLEILQIQTEQMKQAKLQAEIDHLSKSDENARERIMVEQVIAETKARETQSKIARNYAETEGKRVDTLGKATAKAEDLIKE